MSGRAKMISMGDSCSGLSLDKGTLESLGIVDPEIGQEYEMVITAKVESKHESQDSKGVYLMITHIGMIEDESDKEVSADRIKKLYRIEGQFEDQ